MRFNDTNVNARGLSKDEIQAAIDRTVLCKGRPIAEIVERQRESILQLIELDAVFAEMAIKCIKKSHPEILKNHMNT